MAVKVLKRDEILAVKDYKRVLVDVPEWGGSVYVATLTGSGRDAFEQYVMPSAKEQEESKKTGKKVVTKNFRAALLSRCLVDEEGTLLFNESDIEALGQKSARAIERLVDVAQEINGLSKKDAEELEKNSQAAPAADSVSS